MPNLQVAHGHAIPCKLNSEKGKHQERTLMFMRSASEEVAPWAQQEPQYWGMCCSRGTSGCERQSGRGKHWPNGCWAPAQLPCHGRQFTNPSWPHLVARGGQEVGAVDAAPVPVLGQLLGVEVGVRQRRLDQRLVVGWPANFGGKYAGLSIAPQLRARLRRLLRGQVGSLGGAAGGRGVVRRRLIWVSQAAPAGTRGKRWRERRRREQRRAAAA